MVGVQQSPHLDVGYPIYGVAFVDNKTLLVTGGGGEGNHGIPNKITAVKCLFKQKEKTKILQRFREIILPANEDSPMCIDICKSSDPNTLYNFFVGCNQSTELMNKMEINNSLRKYEFKNDEHLKFNDAAQLIKVNESGEYPKFIRLTSQGTIGSFMTSRIPSTIYFFDPNTLESTMKYEQKDGKEIFDFSFSPNNDGKTLVYITASTIETVSPITGAIISTTTGKAPIDKILSKYKLSKVRFINDTTIVIAASIKNNGGIALLTYSLTEGKFLQEKIVSTKIKTVPAFDVSSILNLLAIGGNDESLTIIRLNDLKVLKTFKKVQAFTITGVKFSPNGTSIATISAANSLNVFKFPPNYSQGKSTIGSIISYLFFSIFIILIAFGIQKAHETGHLEQSLEYSKSALKIGYNLSIDLMQKFYEVAESAGLKGYKFVKDKLKDENLTENVPGYIQMDDEYNRGLTESNDYIQIIETTATSTTPQTLSETQPMTRKRRNAKRESSISTPEPLQSIIEEIVEDINEVSSSTSLQSEPLIETSLSSLETESTSFLSSSVGEDNISTLVAETYTETTIATPIPEVDEITPEEVEVVEVVEAVEELGDVENVEDVEDVEDQEVEEVEEAEEVEEVEEVDEIVEVDDVIEVDDVEDDDVVEETADTSMAEDTSEPTTDIPLTVLSSSSTPVIYSLSVTSSVESSSLEISSTTSTTEIESLNDNDVLVEATTSSVSSSLTFTDEGESAVTESTIESDSSTTTAAPTVNKPRVAARRAPAYDESVKVVSADPVASSVPVKESEVPPVNKPRVAGRRAPAYDESVKVISADPIATAIPEKEVAESSEEEVKSELLAESKVSTETVSAEVSTASVEALSTESIIEPALAESDAAVSSSTESSVESVVESVPSVDVSSQTSVASSSETVNEVSKTTESSTTTPDIETEQLTSAASVSTSVSTSASSSASSSPDSNSASASTGTKTKKVKRVTKTITKKVKKTSVPHDEL